jgi:membrane protein YqaA with SNARE-associated domain
VTAPPSVAPAVAAPIAGQNMSGLILTRPKTAGSEPAVFALVKLNPERFWPAIGVATLGATLGGAVTWWMGYGAERAYERMTHKHPDGRALRWLRRFGPKACLLSWLPIVGDPLCAVAGWLKLPFWPCLVYMTIGKFGRYFVMTASLIWFFPGQYTR